MKTTWNEADHFLFSLDLPRISAFLLREASERPSDSRRRCGGREGNPRERTTVFVGRKATEGRDREEGWAKIVDKNDRRVEGFEEFNGWHSPSGVASYRYVDGSVRLGSVGLRDGLLEVVPNRSERWIREQAFA